MPKLSSDTSKETAAQPMDTHVGQRLRMRRMLLGVSQEKLAQQLGISFQQVQKYERGQNRVSASRLHQLADLLAVPVDFFFEDGPGATPEKKYGGLAEPAQEKIRDDRDMLQALLQRRDVVDLLKNYESIKNPQQKKKILALVRAMRGEE